MPPVGGAESGLHVEIIATPSLGDRSYVVHDGAAAAVVDPQRDIDRVEVVLDAHRLTLAGVVETHLHNDYVTGGLALAREYDAPYVVPAVAEARFARRGVRDGERVSVGGFALRVVATPGHTPHHVAYVLEGDGGVSQAVFTGGSLLQGSVGRTDLIAPDRTAELAGRQWASVRRLVRQLPDDAVLLPTHGFGSLCSASPTRREESTIGQERRANPALVQDREPFVRDLLAQLDAYPAYYAHMAPANAAGPGAADLSLPPRLGRAELRNRIRNAEWVIDLRPRAAFAAEHIRGTVSLDVTGPLATYLGWLAPWGAPVTLLGGRAEQISVARRELSRIGFDRVTGYAIGVPAAWARPEELTGFRRADFAELATTRASRTDVVVLDVRRRLEWRASHLDGARNIPLHELSERVGELPPGPV